MRSLVSILIAAALIGLLNGPPRRFALATDSVIPDARVVRVLAKSHLSFVADLYWIRMASMAVAANNPPEGRTLIYWGEFVSDLDPHISWVYMLGGLLGAIKVDNKLFNGPEAAALLDKGTRHVPDEIRLYLYLASQQIDLKRNLEAAETLRRALPVSRCPSYVPGLIARLLAEADQFDAAREFAAHLAESDDPVERETFTRRVAEIDREVLLHRIDQAVARFEASFGRKPFTLDELISQRFLDAAPVDPLGGTVRLDDQGRAVATSGKRLSINLASGEQFPEVQ